MRALKLIKRVAVVDLGGTPFKRLEDAGICINQRITAEEDKGKVAVIELGGGLTYEQEWPYPLQCKFELPPTGGENNYEIALFYHVGMLEIGKLLLWTSFAHWIRMD